MQEAEVRLLDTNTSNQIAAGEVVEKPASVVKELVENALDAGATSIDVTIFEGGIEYIRVADNGSGMSEANARLAVRRHATSKLRSAEDLQTLQTMGFRGEALPSIASVSEFELLTRTADQELATSLKINGGTEQECIQTGGPEGTTVIVRNLFYNVPARRKFLHTATTEGRYITELLTRLALARPEVRFKLTSNDKEVLVTPGVGGLETAIQALYGKKVASELLPVHFTTDALDVDGFVGKPTLLKGTRGWESIFVNGRIINNRMVAKAIDHAYQSQIPKSGFPFVVLNLTVDTHAVDVNVHPQKSEVKFSDESAIYKGVYAALNSALAKPLAVVNQPAAGPTGWQKPESPELTKEVKPCPSPEAAGFLNRQQVVETAPIWKTGETVQTKAAGLASGRPADPTDRKLTTGGPELSQAYLNETSPAAYPRTAEKITFQTAGISEATGDFPKHKPDFEGIWKKPESSAPAVAVQAAGKTGLAVIWPLGQVDRTFIIAQSETSLFIIDQHAAHERILYDKLVLSHNEVPAQQLLLPLYVDAKAQDVELITAHQEEFARLGVELAPGGEETLRISTLPVDIKAAEAPEFIADIANYLREHATPKPSELRQDILHLAACHGAIKAGEVLNTQQMEKLIQDLCCTTHPFTCPHGRPCMLEITPADLYKMFKRTGFNLPSGLGGPDDD
jgi:DNA mismatch repair protein MutL